MKTPNRRAPRRFVPVLPVLITLALSAFGAVSSPAALADAECGPHGPPPRVMSEDVSAVYGQPATPWISGNDDGVGCSDLGDGHRLVGCSSCATSRISRS